MLLWYATLRVRRALSYSMNAISSYLLVFLGAGLGGTLRHTVNRVIAASGGSFPLGTLIVNCTGGIAMGLLAGALALRTDARQPLLLFATTGVLGGFTTFSAYSLDVVLLWERGQTGWAIAYALGSVVCAVGGVLVGLAITRSVA